MDEFIRITKDIYLNRRNIVAVRLLKSEEGKVALKYYTMYGNCFITDYVDDINELTTIIPDMFEDVMDN